MICDHENATTLFCPHCGKNLESQGLLGLLIHCRRQAANLTKNFETRMARIERGRSKSHPKQNFPKAIKKWEKWADELEKLLENQN